jgi:hypothetical protein
VKIESHFGATIIQRPSDLKMNFFCWNPLTISLRTRYVRGVHQIVPLNRTELSQNPMLQNEAESQILPLDIYSGESDLGLDLAAMSRDPLLHNAEESHAFSLCSMQCRVMTSCSAQCSAESKLKFWEKLPSELWSGIANA